MQNPQKTSKLILKYLTKNRLVSGKELTEFLGTISDRAVRKQLKKLLDAKLLVKTGRPPKVFYSLSQDSKINLPELTTNKITLKIINSNYLYISPSGEIKSGWEGFVDWCTKTHQEPLKTAEEYITTLNKYNSFKKNGVIDGMSKIKETFPKIFLDKLFYLDFYSIERFGKTKLGQMLLYGKQSQDKKLIKQLVISIRPKVLTIIKTHKIDGVIFIPPTVKRETQLMKEIEKLLKLPIKTVKIAKIKTDIAIPQKTLNKLSDRIENAANTLIIEDSGSYNNLLIIDDAVGSGATLNETAKQIRKKRLCKGKIIGLAITGSFKGFDVISEV